MGKEKLDLVINVFKSYFEIDVICCDVSMKKTWGKQRHANEEPQNWLCEKCGRKIRFNQHQFTRGKRYYSQLRIVEKRRKFGEKKSQLDSSIPPKPKT